MFHPESWHLPVGAAAWLRPNHSSLSSFHWLQQPSSAWSTVQHSHELACAVVQPDLNPVLRKTCTEATVQEASYKCCEKLQGCIKTIALIQVFALSCRGKLTNTGRARWPCVCHLSSLHFSFLVSNKETSPTLRWCNLLPRCLEKHKRGLAQWPNRLILPL